MSNFAFRFMSLGYKFRDLLSPRMNTLQGAGIKPGFSVLDYGCGPGAYVAAAAQLATESGRVYALDIQPLAIKQVQNIAARQKLANVETILTDCATGLPDESIDIVLLYDIFHGLNQPEEVLTELHRVLKSDGIFSISDHHLKDKDITSKVTEPGLFKLSNRGEKVYNFSKVS